MSAKYYSVAGWAKLCGITRQAVYAAIKEGRVVKTTRGIDAGHPTNRYHFENAGSRGPESERDRTPPAVTPSQPVGPKPKQQARKKSKPSASETESEATQLDLDDLNVTLNTLSDKTQIDAKKKLEEIQQIQIKNQEARGKLIDRDFVRRWFSDWFNIETTELLTLAEKLAPEIAALLGVDDKSAITDVGTYIQKEISRVLDHIENLKNKNLKAIPIEEN